MTVDIELLPLYAELQGHPKIEIIKHYARANVARAVEKWRESIDRAFDDIRELRHEVAAKDAEIKDLVKANEQVQKLALDVLADRDELKAEIESLRAKTAMTMGVGTGDGKLFVHGDYESIKAAQKIVLERDALRTELDRVLGEHVRVRRTRNAAEARAERLEEVLREAQPFIGWIGSYDKLRAKIEALIDHGKETGNG